MDKQNLEIISSGSDLAEGLPLNVMGRVDLSPGAALQLRFTGGRSQSGQVVAIDDSGARAVIEVEGGRWWLRRRNIMTVGTVVFHRWTVGGREILTSLVDASALFPTMSQPIDKS